MDPDLWMQKGLLVRVMAFRHNTAEYEWKRKTSAPKNKESSDPSSGWAIPLATSTLPVPSSMESTSKVYALEPEERILVIDGSVLEFNVLHPAVLRMPPIFLRILSHRLNRDPPSRPPEYIDELKLALDISQMAYSFNEQESLQRILSGVLTKRQLAIHHSSENTVLQEVLRLLSPLHPVWFGSGAQSIAFFHILERTRLYRNASQMVRAAAALDEYLAETLMRPWNAHDILPPGANVEMLAKADIQTLERLSNVPGSFSGISLDQVKQAVCRISAEFRLPLFLLNPWMLSTQKKPPAGFPMHHHLAAYREVLRVVVLVVQGSHSMHAITRKTGTPAAMAFPAKKSTHAWGVLNEDHEDEIVSLLDHQKVERLSQLWILKVLAPIKAEASLSDLKIDSTLNIFEHRKARLLLASKALDLFRVDLEWNQLLRTAGMSVDQTFAFLESGDPPHLFPHMEAAVETDSLSPASAAHLKLIVSDFMALSEAQQQRAKLVVPQEEVDDRAVTEDGYTYLPSQTRLRIHLESQAHAEGGSATLRSKGLSAFETVSQLVEGSIWLGLSSWTARSARCRGGRRSSPSSSVHGHKAFHVSQNELFMLKDGQRLLNEEDDVQHCGGMKQEMDLLATVSIYESCQIPTEMALVQLFLCSRLSHIPVPHHSSHFQRLEPEPSFVVALSVVVCPSLDTVRSLTKSFWPEMPNVGSGHKACESVSDSGAQHAGTKSKSEDYLKRENEMHIYQQSVDLVGCWPIDSNGGKIIDFGLGGHKNQERSNFVHCIGIHDGERKGATDKNRMRFHGVQDGSSGTRSQDVLEEGCDAVFDQVLTYLSVVAAVEREWCYQPLVQLGLLKWDRPLKTVQIEGERWHDGFDRWWNLSAMDLSDIQTLQKSLEMFDGGSSPDLIQAVFYGAHNNSPWVVFVPFEDNDQSSNLDGINNGIWTFNSKRMVDEADKCRGTFNHRDIGMFTLFFTDQAGSLPVNRAFRNATGLTIRGHLLVVQHGDEGGFAPLRSADIPKFDNFVTL
ncbi:hypothetical protein CPB83DRAFT_840961 [Crepidotus variabilis]|uniref:Uncharacterized protein n=1 Tax=Crepidotus variabilis TaxID=179855 RepID=A0A9P6E3G0_9AGAR|nr:hypothetical protein CPB83DRAFT_840961 [Crepidotus variabilis]